MTHADYIAELQSSKNRRLRQDKRCLNCGIDFNTGIWWWRKYCNPRCCSRHRYHKKSIESVIPSLESKEITCPICGTKNDTGSVYWKKFCSDRCRKVNFQREKAKKKKISSGIDNATKI